MVIIGNHLDQWEKRSIPTQLAIKYVDYVASGMYDTQVVRNKYMLHFSSAKPFPTLKCLPLPNIHHYLFPCKNWHDTYWPSRNVPNWKLNNPMSWASKSSPMNPVLIIRGTDSCWIFVPRILYWPVWCHRMQHWKRSPLPLPKWQKRSTKMNKSLCNTNRRPLPIYKCHAKQVQHLQQQQASTCLTNKKHLPLW